MATYNFYKNGDLEKPKGVSQQQYDSAEYGQLFSVTPSEVPARVYIFQTAADISGSSYKRIRSLKNLINNYRGLDEIYNFDNLLNKPISILSLNSYFLGTGIEKGSVELSICLTGTLVDKAEDKKENGVLYNNNNEKVGFVLYREGFIILNNTASLCDESFTHTYNRNINDTVAISPLSSSWSYFGANSSSSIGRIVYSTSYTPNSTLSTNITFTYAEKNDLNHSNNITYLDYNQNIYENSSSTSIVENKTLTIKKTNKSDFISGSADFDKQTFISRVGLYDKDKKLIAIGNLATPIRKTENREFTIKLKLDT